MPVRSLNSSVLRWPDASVVADAVKQWASEVAARRPEAVRVGYFGSYARGDCGVGSDLDLVVIVDRAAEPFPLRRVAWDTTMLPVPADLFVYTEAEWKALGRRGGFGASLRREVVWVYERTPESGENSV